MREYPAPGNVGDTTLFPNCWFVREASLQNILDNRAVFQGLWDGILKGTVDSKVQVQVIDF